MLNFIEYLFQLLGTSYPPRPVAIENNTTVKSGNDQVDTPPPAGNISFIFERNQSTLLNVLRFCRGHSRSLSQSSHDRTFENIINKFNWCLRNITHEYLSLDLYC